METTLRIISPLAAFIAAAFLSLSCGDDPSLDMMGMFDGQSPDVSLRFDGSSGLLQAGATGVCSATDDYAVYVGADMHIDSQATTAHTDAFLSAFAADDSAPFALILGDLVNGKNSMSMASGRVREMAGDKAGSVYMALGNHDIYFNLWEQWHHEWGMANYAFKVTTPSYTDLYICLESASGYLGKKQLDWFRSMLENAGDMDLRHRIVFTHTHMFKKDMSQGHTSNYPMEESYEIMGLMEKHGVELFLSAHSHSRDFTSFKGVDYVVVDALEEHYPDEETGYLILGVGDRFDYDFVTLTAI